MKKLSLKGLDQDLYYDKLDNGLEVVLIPFKYKKGYYVSYTTKYGSINLNFIPENEKKVYNSPLGIAHFLEHKVFEQENGIDPFQFFSKTGTNCNASTSYRKTTYYINGINDIENNIEFLINYVNTPYFTDENVEKEKDIIIQEIKMYEDSPDWLLNEELQSITFKNHPVKYDIGGYSDTVKSITKEDLYTCYNTFYNPNNMVLIVSGDFDKDKVFDLIKNNESLKNKKKIEKIELVSVDEPLSVCKNYKEVTSPNVAVNKAVINFKLSLKDVDDLFEYNSYLLILMSILFGKSSTFKEDLFKLGYASYVDFDRLILDDFILVEIYFELMSNSGKKILKIIKDRLKNKEITIEEFNRYKKVLISSSVIASDNPQAVANNILSDIINCGRIVDDRIGIFKGLSFDKFNEFRNNLDISNYSMVVLKKEK